jgi:hypothetical protein
MNKMETNESSQKIDVAQATVEYQQEAQKAKEEQAANSRFVKLKPGEQKEILLTGVIFSELKEFNEGEGKKKLFVFELTERNAKGENKTFSCSARSTVAGELLKAIQENRRRVTMKRIGEGSSTTYLVVAVQV